MARSSPLLLCTIPPNFMQFRQAIFRHDPKRILEKGATWWRSRQKLTNPLYAHPQPVNMCTKFQEDPIQTVGEDRLSTGQSRKTVARCRWPSWIFRNFFKCQKLTSTTVYNPTKFQGIPSSGFPSRAKTDFGQTGHQMAF